ncbi:MAG: hypothetical protein F2799_04195 [Actinobacteria bacterium]|uniref:Unannotated protein n=1 Tax=freshwater metagenome TaxID=449393 RepID=A0A6J7DQI4_9ZZZZ|nr:hypothetical protein [Actinomycetota bacterium]
MGLEEHSIENLGERCEECGAKLTAQEAADLLESEGPNLCTNCSSEAALGLDEPA